MSALSCDGSLDAFYAALAGALVGGLATALGSLIVSKRGATRAQRARIYDELLPTCVDVALHDARRLSDEPDEPQTRRSGAYQGAFRPVHRAGHLVGGKDAKKVDSIDAVLGALVAIEERGATVFDETRGYSHLAFADPGDLELYQQHLKALSAAIDEYNSWLRERLDFPL